MRFARPTLGWLLAPRQLLALAGICAAAAFLAGYVTIHENASRQLALRQGPPPVVAVEEYRAGAHRGPSGEVVLQAAADLTAPLVLTIPGSKKRALVVPLFPAVGGTEAQGAVLVPLAEGDDMPGPDALAAQDSGGMVRINGRTTDPGAFRLMLAGALAIDGRSLGERFVAVLPFTEGREAAMQPVADPSTSWIWLVSAALGFALAAAYREFAGRARSLRAQVYGEDALRTVSRPQRPVKSDHFAPLPRPEEVHSAPDTGGQRLIATMVAACLATGAEFARGAVALIRTLRNGIADLRSPR